MPTLDLDFSNVENVEAIPKGKYPFEVTDATLRQAEGGEYPYINWQLRINDGDQAGTPLYYITSLSPKSLWRLQLTLQELGIYQEKMQIEADDETGTILQPDLIGLMGIADVGIELYQGAKRNRVVSVSGLPHDNNAVPASIQPAVQPAVPAGTVVRTDPTPVARPAQPAQQPKKGMNLR